jgi:hypothetical protein
MAKRNVPIQFWQISELDRVEALCDALVLKMGNGNRKTAAKLIRSLDLDRRDLLRDQRDFHFQPQTRVATARAREIKALLDQMGWTLRETVDRKLPLMQLPSDLQGFVRSGRVAPSKALLLGRIKEPASRADWTARVLRGATQRELYTALYGSTAANPALEADLQWLSLEASRHLGTRVEITKTTLLIDCQTSEMLSDTLERLGVQI